MKTFWLIFAGVNVLLLAVVIVLIAVLGKRKRDQETDTLPPEEQLRRREARAPGWKIRCLKCGLTEPYGKYGIRKMAAGRNYTLGYCSQCRGLRFYVIEHDKAAR